MDGKTVGQTEYGKASLGCTGLFITLTIVYICDVKFSATPPLVPAVWFYSFSLLGFLAATVLALIAGFRQSRWWWLAALPSAGCIYLMTIILVFELTFGNKPGWH